jgi:hypothetical protein
MREVAEQESSTARRKKDRASRTKPNVIMTRPEYTVARVAERSRVTNFLLVGEVGGQSVFPPRMSRPSRQQTAGADQNGEVERNMTPMRRHGRRRPSSIAIP